MRVSFLGMAILMAGSALAQEGDFRVVAVPWVGTAPEVPHDAVSGQAHFFQAVARGACAQTIQFRWDFDGNDTWDTGWLDAPNRWNLGRQHTLPEVASTRLFVARVQGRCGEATAEAQFPVRVHVEPSLQVRVNRAISNGLWHGHTQLERDATQRTAVWGPFDPETTAAALGQAMMNRGHNAPLSPDVDPYVEDVQWILHAGLKTLQRQNLGLQAGNVNPDTNGNGFGLDVNTEWENYAQGPIAEMLASYGDLGYVVPGNIGARAEVVNRRLRDVVQDIADYFYWSMTDIPYQGDFAGGWSYAPSSAAIDTSQVGWTAVFLFAAEVNADIVVPAWVTQRLVLGARQTQLVPGGYGYFGAGVNHARAGSMLNALGFAHSRRRDGALVAETVDLITLNFNNAFEHVWMGASGLNIGNLYAMYQVTKGLRSFSPAFDVVNGVDWYAQYATYLVDQQRPEGSWEDDRAWILNWNGRRVGLATGFSLQILIPTIFETPPVAIADADPRQVGPRDEVTFRHNRSYNPDPTAPIRWYRWNFIDQPQEDTDGNGIVEGDEIVWDFQTEDRFERPTFSYDPPLAFGDVARYPITLEVEDIHGRRDRDNDSVVITVSLVNNPPVAVPHPGGADQHYDGVPGGVVRLDGRQSFDPDSDEPPVGGFPADTITAYIWDLDNDGLFEVQGAQVPFRVPAAWQVGEQRVVRLQVCDDGRWVGQSDAACGGDCSLCVERDTRIFVVENAPPVAVVDPVPVRIPEYDRGVADGSRSSDPEGAPLDFAWDCDGLPIDGRAGGQGAIDASAIDAPPGGRVFECRLTVTDPAGQADVFGFQVIVENVDTDGDGVDDDDDLCSRVPDPGQQDTDGDGLGDACDPDDDGDGVDDDDDTCRLIPNADQRDTDGDGLGDACDPDDDNDGVPDEDDNCVVVANPDQQDSDGDGRGDACDDDEDGDGVPDGVDTCVRTPNPDQQDTDGDGLGDACDSDDDNDGVPDGVDTCPLRPNPDQTDTDGDGLGDACDPDDDDDEVLDPEDNCPLDPNPDQADDDGDGEGDACDDDRDGDGIADGIDTCPEDPNADQRDQDEDGQGDACDDDRDGDGIANRDDLCPWVTDPEQVDTNGDGVGDACDDDQDGDGIADGIDTCPGVPNDDQTDLDGDGAGDACDADDDGDQVPDPRDNCPRVANADQADLDGDGRGDACDDDDDGDGHADGTDTCARVANPDQADLDGDGAGDACDDDDDGDEVLDPQDNCPRVANPDQGDADGDGSGDACDGDADGDGVADDLDNCAEVANPDQADMDADGRGDACDADRDNDGVPDDADNCPDTFNPDQLDTDEDGRGDACGEGPDPDRDDDGIPDALDNCPNNANPQQSDTDVDGLGDVCDDDRDNDGVRNRDDNCPNDANADQLDADGDTIGDACDLVDDGDGTTTGSASVSDCRQGPGGPATGLWMLLLLGLRSRKRE